MKRVPKRVNVRTAVSNTRDFRHFYIGADGVVEQLIRPVTTQSRQSLISARVRWAFIAINAGAAVAWAGIDPMWVGIHVVLAILGLLNAIRRTLR